MSDNSERSIIRVIVNSIGSAAFIYELVAILGYLSFGKDVNGNIILECKEMNTCTGKERKKKSDLPFFYFFQILKVILLLTVD